MENFKLSDYQTQLIEKMGVFHEKSGMQPAVSRIMALLLIADKLELTFDEIREALKISKSAASNALNMLLKTKKIEYVTYSGDRKRYFRTRIMNWREDMKEKFEGMTMMHTLLREILHQRATSTQEFNKTLKEIIDFMGFFHKEIPLIFKKWEEKNT